MQGRGTVVLQRVYHSAEQVKQRGALHAAGVLTDEFESTKQQILRVSERTKSKLSPAMTQHTW